MNEEITKALLELTEEHCQLIKKTDKLREFFNTGNKQLYFNIEEAGLINSQIMLMERYEFILRERLRLLKQI